MVRLGKPFQLGKATHYNACSCNEKYEPVYPALEGAIATSFQTYTEYVEDRP